MRAAGRFRSRHNPDLTMRTIRILAAPATFVALTLAGCSGDRITGSSDSALQSLRLSKSASVERPWKGNCHLDAQFIGPTTLSITGTCQLAHLGRTSVSIIQQVVFGPIIAYTNAATYTAANGDKLYTTNVGTATPTLSGLTLLGTETAVGGTGRFANASGTAALTGAVTFTGPTTTTGGYSLDGRLSY